MGHPENITNHNTFKHLSEHWGTSLKETQERVLTMFTEGKVTDEHVIEIFDKAAKAWGQSVDEAKQNAIALLKSELSKN